MSNRLGKDFFTRSVLQVAPDLLGKIICREIDGKVHRFVITETEAYSGKDDLACHASKGKTKRTAVMFEEGGLVYVYLIYGMYWMLNFVSGKKDEAAAVLIRGVRGIDGPGRVGKQLQIDKSFYGEDVSTSARLWIEDNKTPIKYKTKPRIGIDYAGEPWKSMPWRFVLK